MADSLSIALDGVDEPVADAIREIVAQRPGEPLTAGELREIFTRADDLRTAYSGVRAAADREGMLPRVVEVGNIRVRSLSIAGRIALRKLVAWAPELDQETYDLLTAWVFAHSWDMEAMARLVDLDAAAAIVADWHPGLTCTPAQLEDAIRRVTGGSRPPDRGDRADDTPADPARTLDSLAQRWGMSPADLMHLPDGLLSHLIDGANLNDRESEARMAAASGRLPPAETDERVNAVARWNRMLQRIRGVFTPGEDKA